MGPKASKDENSALQDPESALREDLGGNGEGDRGVHSPRGMGKNQQKDFKEQSLANTSGEAPVNRERRIARKVGLKDFELLSVIGRGSFGKVLLVRKRDEGKVQAMKILKKGALIEQSQVKNTKSEREILQMIRHPFTVRLDYCFQTKEKLYMVMNYINGGEVFFHLKREGRFSEERTRFYTAEIISAIHHLHMNGIMYRDLKPENILLDNEGHICITDFGLSKRFHGSGRKTHTFCGTPEYLAPEVLNVEGHDKSVDWWSLGTLVYEMLTGLPPFYSQNVNLMYHKILNGELRFPSYLSTEAKSLLVGLLTRDPKQRLGATEDEKDLLEHPFFEELDWEKLNRREIQPLFKPNVNGEADTSQIDSQILKSRVLDSPVESSEISAFTNEFEGFSYVSQFLNE